MKRYDIYCDCEGGHYIVGELDVSESTDGEYVLWSDVEYLLTDILDAWDLEEALNYVRPHINEGKTL